MKEVADPRRMQDAGDVKIVKWSSLPKASPQLHYLEQATGIWNVISSNPVGDSDFFSLSYATDMINILSF